ncbi:mechanosensitive ion channel family protein [Aureibaculum conchae]|uniref:mechanosensitive ion channel family protein n=1 Tax=Aureibaculum sp. 2308TA14-22 TaxID=3108392 RepID=UPI00339094CD
MKEQILSSIEYIGIFICILLITIVVAFLINRFFKRLIRRSTEEMKNDPTNYKFLRHAINAIIYIIGFSIAIYSMPNLRALASSLLAGAGILAVSVGFASQHALSNIISGVFIIIFKPFRVNDRVNLRELRGVVEDITLRHTVIRDFENKRIIIPNSLISDEILVNSNYGDERICKLIEIGISYDSDFKKAKAIFKEEVLKHPLHIDPRTEEQLMEGEELAPVRIIGFGESSVNLRAWAWAKDPVDAFKMECELFELIKKRFDNEGIEIPFPHRTLVYKNNPTNI